VGRRAALLMDPLRSPAVFRAFAPKQSSASKGDRREYSNPTNPFFNLCSFTL